METTVITIIGNDYVVPRANVSVVEEHYSYETVTITLEWSQGEGIIYDFTVSTSPPTSVQTNGTTSTRAKLVLSYNTRYSVSVTHCGGNSTTTFQLHYVTCSLPVALPPNTTLMIFSSLALVGTTATVNCDGLNKTAIITCMEDGAWQPDVLNDTNLCKLESIIPTTVISSTGSAISTTSNDIDCDCTSPATFSQNAVIAIITSVMLVSSVTFVVGFISGVVCLKVKRSSRCSKAQSVDKQDSSQLEMNDNVAYGSVKL